MVSKEDNWIRIFDISEISKHKKGFTIYKVISMVYPRNCPDSITKVTVWKRYNDFRKLHRAVKDYCKLLNTQEKLPNLSKASYFRRFNEDVIEDRKATILRLLEFIGAHPNLFTSDICVQFFKTSYTPSELLSSNINSIRAKLNLPAESDYSLVRSNSEDDHTLSDTDSISTLNSTIEQLPDPLSHSLESTKASKKIEYNGIENLSTRSHDSISLSAVNISLESSEMGEKQCFPTPPQTPNSMTSSNSIFYVLEASQHIKQAIDFEVDNKYEEAFSAYKFDDKDLDRRHMIRRKIEKYLLRAEKIYNLHLSLESKVIQSYSAPNIEKEKQTEKQSSSDLYKYKVIKIIASGMLVLHSDLQQLYYIKVINKTSQFLEEKMILPKCVPYMVKLYDYYNCENALFLVIQYCNGVKLDDYIKQKLSNPLDIFNMSMCSNLTLSTSFHDEPSDYDSDYSYSDLIQDYNSNKLYNHHSKDGMARSDIASDTVSCNEFKFTSENANDLNFKMQSSDRETILRKSEEIISSANLNIAESSTLQSGNCISNEICNQKQDTEFTVNKSEKSSRKSSVRSEWSSFDDYQFNENHLIPIADVIKWAAQLLVALENLHSLGVICCTNDLTLAPELYGFQPITDSVDWWSYGAILYEVLVGMPLKDIHPEGLTAYTNIKIPKYVTVEGRSLLKQLLAYEPHERLGSSINGAEDIKSHPFFNIIVWDNVV